MYIHDLTPSDYLFWLDPIWGCDSYKPRLVANGSTQLKGVDVDETFSLVKSGTIRIVLSLATSRHWLIHQLDVKNAFLHGDLSKTVYIHQSLGFRDYVHPDYVFLLQRSLYGLKQALRAWFQREGTDTAYLLLYVDDISIVTSGVCYDRSGSAKIDQQDVIFIDEHDPVEESSSNIFLSTLSRILSQPKKHDGLSHEKANGLNTKVDEANNFLASIFEGDSLDESVLIDWLKLNVGDHEECEKVLNGVKARVFKADALINELRAMGHDLSEDFIVDLNFFRED
ncbi:ribonuclease H-like domain-containing protein [Tanacetum coccineum]